MNWRGPVIRSLLGIQNPEVLRELELIHSIERAPPAAIRAVQQERLSRLLQHAWGQTDYYREVLEACGAVRNGRVNLDRFEDIPFLTKDIIRSQAQRLRARELPGGRVARYARSGGSTGEPVQFFIDSVYWAATIAVRTYHFSLAGKDLGEREMKIWGHESDFFKGTLGLRTKLENWLYNRKFEECWHLPEQRILKIIRDINEWRPRMLWCYRDGIHAIANYINRNRLEVHSPAAVVLGGATVYPFMVQTIEQAFSAPVISAYGSREIGAAACQCLTREGHHLASQSHVVETIDADERVVMEQDAELVITPLLNYAFPFVRYRIGDRGRLTSRQCSCGRSFPLLAALSGRLVEVFQNSRGEQVDPMFFMWIMAEKLDKGRTRKAQVVQEEDGSITINLVLEPGVRPQDVATGLADVPSRVRSAMGQDCQVNIVFVEDIPLNPSGKHPYIISRRRPSGAQAPGEMIGEPQRKRGNA